MYRTKVYTYPTRVPRGQFLGGVLIVYIQFSFYMIGCCTIVLLFAVEEMD